MKGVVYPSAYTRLVIRSRFVKEGLRICTFYSLIWKITFRQTFYPPQVLYQEKSVSFVLDIDWLSSKHCSIEMEYFVTLQ